MMPPDGYDHETHQLFDGGDEAEFDCGKQVEVGRCPCCFGYTRTWGGNYVDDPMQERCEDCGWEGEIEY